MAANAANEYQILRSELATAESQLSDLRQRLDREVSEHKATKDKEKSTANANVDLHKALNKSQAEQKYHAEEMSAMKATVEEATRKAVELEKRLEEATERRTSHEQTSHTLNAHIESLQRSLKQEQSAHKTTRSFMAEQAEQLRSLQRTLAAAQQQRRLAQQAQLEATSGRSSNFGSPVRAGRSHSPIRSPRGQKSEGQRAVQSALSNKPPATVQQLDNESDVSYISDSHSEDDLLGGSGSASGSALAAIRSSRRPASALAASSGQPGDPMARFVKYGRRIRTKSARPRLGVHSGGLAEAAVEPATRAATAVYR